MLGSDKALKRRQANWDVLLEKIRLDMPVNFLKVLGGHCQASHSMGIFSFFTSVLNSGSPVRR